MPSLTVENYLKAALQLCIATDSEWVSPGQLATALEVSPGTVTSMLKTLAESGLAKYKPYSGLTLTDAGRKLALRMLRRHRLIELFLVKTLDLTWDQVHAEAEHMEHAMSDMLIDRIDAYLGHPETDPHGDPIPTATGELRGSRGQTRALSMCEPPGIVRIARVVQQQPEFLRYLAEHGLTPGAEVRISRNSAEGGIVELEVHGKHGKLVSLGHSAAEQILVEPLV